MSFVRFLRRVPILPFFAFLLGVIVAITVTVHASAPWNGPTANPPGSNVSLSLLGQWTTSGSNIYYSGGNVGIGTASSPRSQLDVASGAVLNNVAVGSAPFGTITWPYESIQLPAGNNLRINFASNQRDVFFNDGGVWLANGNLTSDASGNVTAVGTVTAAGYFHSSDARLKNNIQTFSDGLDAIEQLRGVTFNWKKDGTPSAGVIAQEVEKVMPSAVHADATTGMKSVEYDQLIAPMIEAIKEQQKEIDVQRQEIDVQNQKIDTLAYEITQLKTHN